MGGGGTSRGEVKGLIGDVGGPDVRAIGISLENISLLTVVKVAGMRKGRELLG